MLNYGSNSYNSKQCYIYYVLCTTLFLSLPHFPSTFLCQNRSYLHTTNMWAASLTLKQGEMPSLVLIINCYWNGYEIYHCSIIHIINPWDFESISKTYTKHPPSDTLHHSMDFTPCDPPQTSIIVNMVSTSLELMSSSLIILILLINLML